MLTKMLRKRVSNFDPEAMRMALRENTYSVPQASEALGMTQQEFVEAMASREFHAHMRAHALAEAIKTMERLRGEVIRNIDALSHARDSEDSLPRERIAAAKALQEIINRHDFSLETLGVTVAPISQNDKDIEAAAERLRAVLRKQTVVVDVSPGGDQ
jgi:hypothetical protein